MLSWVANPSLVDGKFLILYLSVLLDSNEEEEDGKWNDFDLEKFL